jgi:alpha-1,3/alpha-1,6-mannosyltransferase
MGRPAAPDDGGASARPLRIAFLHPDLGLGGAERLVVDAAVELVARGHTVDFFTSHYDPRRCFQETLTGGFSITVAGAWFPRHVLGRLYALCAYVRCVLAALYMAVVRCWLGGVRYDVVIADQVRSCAARGWGWGRV